MKVLILNSGMGSRMGVLASEQPKCMTEISKDETIISRQLKQVLNFGINEVVITTGRFDSVLVNYCKSLELPLHITYVKNPIYEDTNYIYSIYCAKDYVDDDIILLHGDLVFEDKVLEQVVNNKKSCMTVSTTLKLSDKDFKAIIQDGKIFKVGVDFLNGVMAQPCYKLLKKDWKVWLDKIIEFCESNQVKCYAENAFNELSGKCVIYPLDVKNLLCNEIDNSEDLAFVSERLKEI